MRLKYIFPAGACTGTTQKGKTCRLRDVYENFRCKHHGGEGMLLRVQLAKARALKKVKRARRRAAKFDRFLKKMLAADPGLRERVERINNAKKRPQDLARLGDLERFTVKSAEGETPDMRSEDPQGNPMPAQALAQG